MELHEATPVLPAINPVEIKVRSRKDEDNLRTSEHEANVKRAKIQTDQLMDQDKLVSLETARKQFRDSIKSISPNKRPTNPFEFLEYIQKRPKSKEFVYLTPKDSGISGRQNENPYDLIIVDYMDIDKAKGFYTMSAEVRIPSFEHVRQFFFLGHYKI